MAISEILMWTLVFIIATGFVTVVSTAVLLKRARRRPDADDPQAPSSGADTEEDEWEKDDWNHDDWKKGNWKD